MIDFARLKTAYQTAAADLLAERDPAGHWIGELATSALSTATAVSALSLVLRAAREERGVPFVATQRLQRLMDGGVQYLATHQNPDGGWGDTDKSFSNIATTMLAVAAFHVAGQATGHVEALRQATLYIQKAGGLAGLRRRYGKDKTFAVPILTNYALAGLVSWKEVSPLPFELACLPQSFYRFVRLPVVSYAIPALVAIGQARYFYRKPWNPIARIVRAWSVNRSLTVLRKMQPASGGYLEAVPLTSFVVMSLAATGRASHPVTQSGVQFLLDSVRRDGSWPIDTNLATWNTTLAITALDVGWTPRPSESSQSERTDETSILHWLLSCQNRERHPFTGADPGGWGWSDLSGAVPDADDTPGALLALAQLCRSAEFSEKDRARVEEAVTFGLRWLLGLQNRDGGWPTFCRGWGTLPFDRSGADLTAHAIRALFAWRDKTSTAAQQAAERGFVYLERQQRADGSWLPLWFGNQSYPDDENPVYGTAKVLLAYRDSGRMSSNAARRGIQWLATNQNRDGGWGRAGGYAENDRSSVEETALAVEALLADNGDPSLQTPIAQGLDWLIRSVETRQHLECSPIGFYFAKLWYYEKLYPLTFTVSALGAAVRAFDCRQSVESTRPAKTPD